MKTVTFKMINPPVGLTAWEVVWAGADMVWHGMTTFKPIANPIPVTMADDGQYVAFEAGIPGQTASYVVAWQAVFNFVNGATYVWDVATGDLSGPGIGGSEVPPGTGPDLKKYAPYIIVGALALGMVLVKKK